jgi:hypothetical protein
MKTVTSTWMLVRRKKQTLKYFDFLITNVTVQCPSLRLINIYREREREREREEEKTGTGNKLERENGFCVSRNGRLYMFSEDVVLQICSD